LSSLSLAPAAAPVSATASAPPALAPPPRATNGSRGTPRPAADMAAVSAPIGLGGRRSQATERVMEAVSGLPAALSAHVKLRTMSLTAIVAATFAGGLFVGRLVWRDPAAAMSASVADSARIAPSVVPRNDTTLPATTTLPAAGPGAAHGQPMAATAPAGGAAVIPSTPPTAAVIVTPVPPSDDEPAVAAQPEELAVKPVVKKPRIRARPPAPPAASLAAAPEAAPITAGRAPARQPVTGSASKTMATTAPAKPAKKGKPAWHDPFAD